jgi:hypothetical protein
MCELRVADWTGRVAGFDLGLGFQSRDLLFGLVPAWTGRYAGLELGFGSHGCDLLFGAHRRHGGGTPALRLVLVFMVVIS